MKITQLSLDLGKEFNDFNKGYCDYNTFEYQFPRYPDKADYMEGWDKARKEHQALIEQRNLEVQRKYSLED